MTWTEGDAAVALDGGGDATVSDVDSADFDGGKLTVGDHGGWRVRRRRARDSRRGHRTRVQIGVSGSNVTYGGTTIGTFTGGCGGVALGSTSTPTPTPAAVQALMHDIEYNNTGGDNPTDGDRTVTWTLVDGDGTANGGNDTLTMTTTVNVNPVDDAPVAQDLTRCRPPRTRWQRQRVRRQRLGRGQRSRRAAAAGRRRSTARPANVGTPVTLASGALLTVNADGSFSYDPNGQFDYLVSSATAAATGAVNDTATDTLHYTLAGGNTATVT